jgi:hypothetical protein
MTRSELGIQHDGGKKMVRSIVAFAMAALFSGGVLAKGGGGYYIVTAVPAVQPGDTCVAEGAASGKETKTADGTTVLAKSVHGVNTVRCPNPSFPTLATTQKLASDEVRNAPSSQCVSQGVRVGDELTIPHYGVATVLELRPTGTKCYGDVEAIVISTAAYRASQAAQATKDAASKAQSVTPYEPTDAEIQQEYDRVVASTAPVKEFHVRHILVRNREEAVSALEQIKSGKSFAEVAAEVSTDSGSRSRGGDLGWNRPSSFIEEFSKTMVSLAPAGLAPEPTQTRFGWHVIEVLETKTGKDSFPPLSLVKDRIVAKLKAVRRASTPVVAKAVCRKMVAPELPAAVLQEGVKGSVIAEMRIENGKVAQILSLSGPSIFHPAVIEAVNKYECDRLDRAVIATQSFDF